MTDHGDGSSDSVDLTKTGSSGSSDASGAGDPAPEQQPDFDPYRFGAPEHPVPPEYAPPGYTPPQPTTTVDSGQFSPYGSGSPYGPPPQSPYGGQAPNPYGGQPSGYPYGPPPQSPYGPPPGYPQPGYGQQEQGNGKAVGALVCGILSIVLCWLTLLDLLLIVPAIVLGAMTLSNRASRSRGMAWAGIICAALGAILAIVITVVALHLAQNCEGRTGSDQQQCIRDQF